MCSALHCGRRRRAGPPSSRTSLDLSYTVGEAGSGRDLGVGELREETALGPFSLPLRPSAPRPRPPPSAGPPDQELRESFSGSQRRRAPQDWGLGACSVRETRAEGNRAQPASCLGTGRRRLREGRPQPAALAGLACAALGSDGQGAGSGVRGRLEVPVAAPVRAEAGARGSADAGRSSPRAPPAADVHGAAGPSQVCVEPARKTAWRRCARGPDRL